MRTVVAGAASLLLLGAAGNAWAGTAGDPPGPTGSRFDQAAAADSVLKAGQASAAATSNNVAASRVVLENLSGQYAGARVTAARVVLEGFEQVPSADLANSLENLAIGRVTIPELDVEQPDVKAHLVYHDITLEGLAGGRAAKLSVASGDGAVTSPDGKEMHVSIGAMGATGVDIAALMHLGRPAAADAPFRTLYDTAAVASVTIQAGDEGEIRIGESRVRDLAVRPGVRPLFEEFSDLGARAQKLDGMDSAESQKLAEDWLGLFGRIRLGSFEARDMVIKAKPDQLKGKPEHDAEPVDMRIGRIAVRDIADRRIGAIEYGGVDIRTPDGAVAFDLLALRGFGFPPAPESGSIEALVPRLEGFRIEKASLTGSGVDGSLGLLDLGLGDYIGPVPTAVSFTMRGFAVPVPSEDDKTELLRKLGYQRFEMAADFETGWSAASRAYAVRKLSTAVVGAGKVSLSASLGDFGSDAFATDPEKAMAAVMGAKLQSVVLRLENTGLFERIVTFVAHEQGKPEADVRAALGLQAAAFLLEVPDKKLAAEISKAINAFLENPKALEIRLQPPQPLPLSTIAESADDEPGKVVEKLGVTIRANP